MGNEDIKISVIVPIYNTEKYLKRCINSILIQNFLEYELILINDGSKDKSLEVAKSYADSRIVLISKENEGLSATRNLGIKIARGEYILHIDSDDWIEQGYLNDVYSRAKEKDADIVVTDFYIDYDNGELKYIRNKMNKEETNLSSIENLKNGGITPNVWNKLIRKRLYVDNNILHPIELSYGEDLAVIPRLMYYAKKVVYINKAYVHYIQNPDSIVHNISLKTIYDLDKSCEILENFFRDREIDNISEFRRLHFSRIIYKYSNDFKDKKSKEIISKYFNCIKTIKLVSIKNKRYRIYIFFLKIFNNIAMLRILQKIDLIYSKIRKIN